MGDRYEVLRHVRAGAAIDGNVEPSEVLEVWRGVRA